MEALSEVRLPFEPPRRPHRRRDQRRNREHPQIAVGKSEPGRVDRAPADLRGNVDRRYPARRAALHQDECRYSGGKPRERAQQERQRDIDSSDVRANESPTHSGDSHQLELAREDGVLCALKTRRVERIDHPRVDRPVGEGGGKSLENFCNNKLPVVMRHEIEHEGRHMNRAANHHRGAASDRVGEGSRRHVGQEHDYQVRCGDQVGLELVESARAEEQRVDRENKRRSEAVQRPDDPVAPDERSDRVTVLSRLSWYARRHDRLLDLHQQALVAG